MKTRLLITFLSLLFCGISFAQGGKYEVFVAGYNQRVPVSYFKGLKVAEKFSYGQIYNYYVTGFNTPEEAEKVKKEAMALGFKDARVEDITEKAGACCYGYQPPKELQQELSKIRNIFFDFDKSNIRSDAAQQLNALARIMKENPNYTVEFHAHTDAKGSNAYNESLAKRREAAAASYLTKKGIAKNRISGSAFGEEKPIAKNEVNGQDTPEGRQFNRRVEIMIKDGGTVVNMVEDINVPAPLKQ